MWQSLNQAILAWSFRQGAYPYTKSLAKNSLYSPGVSSETEKISRELGMHDKSCFSYANLRKKLLLDAISPKLFAPCPL